MGGVLRAVWRGVTFVLAMLLVGVPGALWVVVRQVRGVLVVAAGWWVGMWAGLLPVSSGPGGFPGWLFWPFTVMFVVWWVFGAGLVAVSALSKLREATGLMRDFGMPPSEIV